MATPGPGRARPAFETAILLASAVTLLLPAGAGLAALAGLIALWLAVRPPRQERVFVAVALTLAAGLLLASALSRGWDEPSIDDWAREVESAFSGLWDEIGAAAARAAASLEAPRDRRSTYRDEFETLAALLPEQPSDLTFLLLTPEGTAAAWAGEGLLHEGDLAALPVSGFAHRRGYNAVTMLAVEPLSGSPRPWRLVAGRSLPADRLPFATSAVSSPENLRWSLGPPTAPVPDGVLKLEHEAAPAVFLDRPLGLDRPLRRLAGQAHRLGAGLLGLTLLALALLRATGDSTLR